MNYKIFDLGGSFLKIYSSFDNNIIRIPMFQHKIIVLQELKNIILNNIDDNTSFIALSSQMHGFVLFDENNNNISNFITWKNNSDINILNNNIFNDFYITGLKKRTDLPINNINNFIINSNLYSNKNLYKKIYFKNITEAILDIPNNITHTTMACGSGFYDIFNNNYINKYIEYFKNTYNIDLIFDDVIDKINISGYIKYNDKLIPVYIGIGDFQASLYGSLLSKSSLIINMATGSQIAKIIDKNEINILNLSKYSFRPYFNNTYLQCFTHIPSGRFLNIFVNFFKELNIDLWKYFNNITLDDIKNSNLNISTDIFSINGLFINGINEDNFNINNLAISIIKNYVYQYINIINENYNISSINNILLSGGIPKKIKIIKEIFKYELNKEVLINDIDDDSLNGVKNLIK